FGERDLDLLEPAVDLIGWRKLGADVEAAPRAQPAHQHHEQLLRLVDLQLGRVERRGPRALGRRGQRRGLGCGGRGRRPAAGRAAAMRLAVAALSPSSAAWGSGAWPIASSRRTSRQERWMFASAHFFQDRPCALHTLWASTIRSAAETRWLSAICAFFRRLLI